MRHAHRVLAQRDRRGCYRLSSKVFASLDLWSIASLYRSGKVVSAPGQGVKRICGRDVLSNDAVNLVSAMLAALLTGTVAWYWVSLSIGTS